MNTGNRNKAPYTVPWGRRITGNEIPFGSTESEGDTTPTTEVCTRAKSILTTVRISIKGGPRRAWNKCDGTPGGSTTYYSASMSMKRTVDGPEDSICRQSTPTEVDVPGEEVPLCPCEDGCCSDDTSCENFVDISESGFREQAPIQWGGQGDFPVGVGSARICKCTILPEDILKFESVSNAIIEKMRTEKVSIHINLQLKNVRQLCCIGEGSTANEKAESLEECQRMVCAGYKVDWDDYPEWVQYMFRDSNNNTIDEQLAGNFDVGPFHVPDTSIIDGHVCDGQSGFWGNSNMFEMDQYVAAKCQKPREVINLTQGLFTLLKVVGMGKLCTFTTAPAPDIVKLVDGPYGSPAADVIFPIGHPLADSPECPLVPVHLLQMALNVLQQITPDMPLC